jgi:hypothetical protein
MREGAGLYQAMLPIIASCYPMIANPRVKTHGCCKTNPINGVKTKNNNLSNFFDPVLTGWYLTSRVVLTRGLITKDLVYIFYFMLA